MKTPDNNSAGRTAAANKITSAQQDKSKDLVNKDIQKATKKKKHNSALAAASQARSAVNQVGGSSFVDGGFIDNGTNLSYKEGE